jgi:hypothetical protein
LLSNGLTDATGVSFSKPPMSKSAKRPSSSLTTQCSPSVA